MGFCRGRVGSLADTLRVDRVSRELWIMDGRADKVIGGTFLLLVVGYIIYYLWNPLDRSETDLLTTGVVVLTLVLAGVTYWYARITNLIAKTNRETLAETQRIALANQKMVSETERIVLANEALVQAAEAQRRAAARPVVTFALQPAETEWDRAGGVDPAKATITRFRLEVRNHGPGPALNIRVDSSDRAFHDYYQFEEVLPPFALGIDRYQVVTLRWRHSKPDTSGLSGDEQWRVLFDSRLDKRMRDQFPDGMTRIDKISAYWSTLRDAPDRFTLVASYFDVYDNLLRSELDLLLHKHPRVSWAAEVEAGVTRLYRPEVSEPESASANMGA